MKQQIHLALKILIPILKPENFQCCIYKHDSYFIFDEEHLNLIEQISTSPLRLAGLHLQTPCDLVHFLLIKAFPASQLVQRRVRGRLIIIP